MNYRINKINAEIQKAISEIITYEMNNPRIRGIITVPKVDTTQDLDYCKVYISILDKDSRNEVFTEIKRSANFIRKQVANKVLLRKMPMLEFILDETLDYGEKIDNMIDQIAKQRGDNSNEN